MCEPNVYGSGNTGYFEEPCIGQAYESCGPNVTQGYSGSGTPWTDMVDGSKTTTSELCVYHDGVDIAYAAVNQ